MEPSFKKLSRKISSLAIPSLMKYIVISMGAVFVLDFIFNGMLSGYLAFDAAAIFSGQIWRLVSFIFIPISGSPIFILFALYFYWMIGEALEREWGVAKFNLYYLTGVACTIIAGLITGHTVNYFLNLSLFFAFAILFPNVEIRLFLVLPVKVKWLACLDAAFFAYMLAISDWAARIALLVSVANVAVFFWKAALNRLVNIRRRRLWRNNFR